MALVALNLLRYEEGVERVADGRYGCVVDEFNLAHGHPEWYFLDAEASSGKHSVRTEYVGEAIRGACIGTCRRPDGDSGGCVSKNNQN